MMMDGLILGSLRNRAGVLVTALILTIVGVLTVAEMPVDVFPDLTAPAVTVITEAHGMAPTELESQVTYLVETALNGAPGVRRVRSSTSVGISIVWCEFEWETDLLTARQVVSERLAVLGSELPPEVSNPIIAPLSSIMGEILFLGLTSDRHDSIELRVTAESLVRRRLLSVPGVSQVTPIGGEEKQYQVRLDPERLLEFDTSVLEVSEALAGSNENVAAGFSIERGQELLVHGRGRLRDVNDVGATVVRAIDGVPLRVEDLGEVVIGGAPRRGEGSVNAQPGVVLGVQKQPAANTLALTRALDEVLDEVEATLPEGMTLHRHVFRQADFIQVAVSNVTEALRDGAILVVVLMLLFLGNARATFITLTAIPLSLVVAVLVLKALDASINTMTLGGMAIAIGALVDDAVIDVENVVRRLCQNAAKPPDERRRALSVVFDASVEIRSSIVFATLIIVLVFLPLFFLTGVEGRLLRPLGQAYVVAILASLLVAITVTPALCYWLLPTSRSVLRARDPAFVHWLKQRYGELLRPLLNHPLLVSLPAVVLLLFAIGASRFLGLSFLPEFNEGALTINAVTVPGTSLEQSGALGHLTEEIVLEHPAVSAVARRTGRAEKDEHALGVESSELEVSLDLDGFDKQQLLEELRDNLALVPGVNMTIGQPISHRIDHMLSGTRASVAVKIFGPDLEQLRRLAKDVEQAMGDVEGVVDLATEAQAAIPLLLVDFDRDAIARKGAVIQEVAHTVEAAFRGHPATRILEGRFSYDVVIQLAAHDPWSSHNLEDLLIDTPGGRVPLSMLADVRRDLGPNTISREDVERKIVVSCNVAGRDVGSVVNDVRTLVDPLLEAEPGYRVEYGGQFESAIEARRRLILLGVGVIAGIAFLLNLAFRSSRDALLIMVNLPLALIGGIGGVFLQDGVLSVASLIGFITVFGIATRNGIMLVSHIRHLQREEGVRDFREAVFRGAQERLAPILMTALATALALIPLALGGDEPGNEIQTPMALVILCGLITSMALNMLVVPVLVLCLGRPVSSSTGEMA